jgi:hypothetical protein|tara:strand:+ start:43 stop:423 length:381 start_codon:yes stop_codon:yes gene_type:complete
MMTFIYSTVFMENNCYRRGYVVEPSPKPEEPLYEIVTTRKMEKVSPFKQINSCGQRYRPCSVAIRSFDGCSSCGGINGLMDESELPDLVNFLVMNGYDINERLTKLMERKMASDEKKLVFVCSYSG